MKRYFILTFLIITACSKFEHTELDLNPPCVLCDWAEQREGTYTGTVFSGSSPNSGGYSNKTIEVQHIFLNQSTYDDSTRMYFNITELATGGSSSSWQARAIDSAGVLVGHSYYNLVQMRGDSIVLKHQYIAPNGLSFYLNGVLYR